MGLQKPLRLVWLGAVMGMLCWCEAVWPQTDAKSAFQIVVSHVKAPLTDWVAQAEVDFREWGELGELRELGGTTTVWEVDEAGKTVGQKVCQFEPREGGDGKLTASGTLYWLMDGATKPGSERRFEARVGGSAAPRAAASGVTIQKDTQHLKVGNLRYELAFDLRAGGVVKEVLFKKSGRRVAFQAGDSLAGESKTGRERAVWRLAADAKPEVRVVSEGPLASVIEVRARFPLSKSRAEDCPLVVYRYTFFAGSPLVKVNVRLPAHDLQTVVEAMAFLQFMASADHPFKRWPSGEPLTTGDLAGAGKHITLSGGGVFKRWGALVNDEDAMGMIGGQLGGMYDGKNGPYLTGYSRAPWRGGPWRGEEVEWTGYLYLGESGRTGEAVGRYAAGLAGYAIRMRIPTLEARIEHEARNAEALVGQLYHGLLWPRQGRENAARVLASTSRMLLSAAAERMEQGREIAALGVLADWADALTAEAGQVFGGKGKVPALPWFGRRGEFVAVANERLALLFHDARLQSVFHSGHAYPLLRFSARPRPLWRLMVKEKASGRLSELSSVGKAVTFGSERSADGGLRLKWEWRDVAVGDDKLRVRVTAALAASDPLTRWRIEVENPSQRFGLWEVDFPVVAGIGKKRTSPESDFLALPFKSGMLVPDPGQGAEYSQGYPGEAAMQFLPYWHGRSGLFMAAYDSAANLKEIKVASADDETVEYRLSHLVPDCGATGKGFTLPYDAILGVFDGDWYDAAKLYRRWALQQPWCPKKPLAANEDIPKWFRESCLTFRPSGEPEKVVAAMENLKRAFGMPAMVNWYEWIGGPPAGEARPYGGKGLHGMNPEVVPPKPGFADAVKRLQAQDLSVAVYVMALMWHTETETWKAEGGEKAAVRLENGEIKFIRYNQEPLAAMCAATPLWQDKMRRVIGQLLDQAAVRGAYLDLAATGVGAPCFSADHGHPVGGGDYYGQGMRALMRAIRQAARSRQPDFVMLGEGSSECFFDLEDSYILYHTVHPSLSPLNIPMLQAVYGDYVRTYGAKSGGFRPEPLEALLPAQLFVFGSRIGRIFDDSVLKDEPRTEFFKRLARYRQAALPWLGHGEMLRPLKIEYVSASATALQEAGLAIQTSTWRAADGSVGFIFANATMSASGITFRIRIEPGEYGIPTDGSYALYELTPESKRKLSAITGPFERTETLPALGARALVAGRQE